MDPDFTIAWNTVFTGTKLWALLPLDVVPLSPTQLTCDLKFSKIREGETSIESWFHHVLPQLQQRKWYGRSAVVFKQYEGEFKISINIISK